MSKPPYVDKPLEDLHVHLKKGVKYMREMKPNDPKREEALTRFYQMIEYYLANTQPLEMMGVLIDKRVEVK